MDRAERCSRFLITGRVQGVFFRASTAREAERLGLKGWARNLPDGRVEVLALGPAARIAALAAWLAVGPPRARVDAVTETHEVPAAHAGLADFRTG